MYICCDAHYERIYSGIIYFWEEVVSTPYSSKMDVEI
jgi:hypothetical protein